MPLFARPALKRSFPSIEEHVRTLVASGKSDQFLLIVPNRIAQRHLERELVESAQGRSIAKPNILTLADFAERLCSVAFPNLSLLSDAKAAVLIEQSIRDLLKDHKLEYFERGADSDIPAQAFPIPRGTFELVVNTIRELKENGVTVEDIEKDLAASQGEQTTELRRAADICEIYRGYHAKLVERNFMDTYGQTLLLNERYKTESIQEDFRAVFPNVSQILLDGFYYLESPTLKLLTAIGSMSDVQTIISLDYREDNPELFGGVLELRSKLFEQGFSESAGGSPSSSPASEAAINALLRRHLCASTEQQLPLERATHISYFEASDPLNEIEEIARQIKLLAQNKAVDLSRIVVGVPAIEDYSMLVEEVFRRCGIPVEIADRQRLDRAPLFLALLALFDLARPAPRLREVLRALASPYFEFSGSSEKIDVQNLLSLLMHQKPSGDLSGWLRSLQMRVDTLKDAVADSVDDDEIRQLEGEIQNTERAITDLARVRSVLAPFQQKMTPNGFVANLREVIRRLHLRENLLARSAETIAAKHLERDAVAFRALTRLVEELESLFRLLGIGEQERHLSYYVERLKAASIYTRYSTRVRERAVLVAPLSQAIAAPADHLFVAGLVEGALPRAYQPQVFLMNQHQRGESKQLREERVLFYQALTHAPQVTLCAPKRTLSGAEVSRSVFLDALSETIEWQTLAHADGVFSWRELHERTGELARLDNRWQNAIAKIENTDLLAEHMPHVLEAESIRSQSEDSVYRGKLDLEQLTAHERELLDKAKTKVWSVTQLELYASCPFKYFAERVLELGQEEEREEGLDARDRGSLLHEILREFMTQRREQKREHLQELSDVELDSAYLELRETAQRHFARIEREHPNRAEHPFWRLDRERLLAEEGPRENVLRRFVRHERELAPFEQRPKFFEVSFGIPLSSHKAEDCDPVLSRDKPVEIEGIKLRGRIDRIDHDDRTFSIVDYKTGKPVSFRAIERGLSLQLPLYIRVAEDLLSSQFPEVRGVAALYHRITQPDSPRELGLALKEEVGRAFEELSLRSSGVIKTREDLQALIEQTVEFAKSYVEGIASGDFRLTRADQRKTSCTYCQYGAVCRVQEAEDLGVLA
jgi:ATP-dependent helicase/nuclease subunit B